MLRHLLTASREGSDKVKTLYIINLLVMTAITAGSFIVYWLLGSFCFRDFSLASFWNINDNFWLSIIPIILPASLYAIFLGQLDWFSDDSDENETLVSESLPFKGLMSLGAGINEELTHRGVFIFFGLIVITLGNLFFNIAIPIALAVIFFIIIANFDKQTWINVIVTFVIFFCIWMLTRLITQDNFVSVFNGLVFAFYK